MCPILCGSMDIGRKWSHLEQIITVLFFTLHIWLLLYQFCIWICLDKSLSPFTIGSLCSILSGIMCPILSGNKNIGFKWSHLEEIITAFCFTSQLPIWMLWYKFGIRIYLDKSLSPLRYDVNVVIRHGYFLHQVTAPSQHSMIISIFNVFLTS